jgi:hypothetical protein
VNNDRPVVDGKVLSVGVSRHATSDVGIFVEGRTVSEHTTILAEAGRLQYLQSRKLPRLARRFTAIPARRVRRRQFVASARQRPQFQRSEYRSAAHVPVAARFIFVTTVSPVSRSGLRSRIRANW